MHALRILCLAGFLPSLLPAPLALAQQATNPAGSALPEIRQLMREVHDHQKAMEKVRENYTYSSFETTQDLDSNGQVKKTETHESEVFYVNGKSIARLVKKDGKPLSDDEQQKETERVTKLVEKAEKPETEKKHEDVEISLGRILEVADVRNPRRESFRGRPAIVFDFVGRKDAKTHGLSEDVSKKLQGTLWVDEADRQIAHLEVSFIDNFNIDGGLLAHIEKGSSFRFDQAQVNGELWLTTGGEGTVQMRLLLVKGIRQHFTVRDDDFKRFRVETQQLKDAKVVPEKAQ
jgi:hypothetical protein